MTVRRSTRRRLVELCVAGIRVAHAHVCDSKFAHQLVAPFITDRKQRHCSAEQPDRRGHIATVEGTQTRCRQTTPGILAQRRSTAILLAELRPQSVRLLEVVPDELVELGQIRRRLVEPVGEALVQLRAQALRGRSVDGVLHEDVAKAERAVASRPYEAASRERREMRVGGRHGVGVEERHDVGGAELLPDYRTALEHGALARAEPVEARSEERLDRLRNPLLGQPALEGKGEELLDEERVALGGRDDARPLVRFEDAAAEPVDEGLGVVRREGVELDAVDVSACCEELGIRLAELLAREADDENRSLALVREVVDELEERRLRPVNVVEDDRERSRSARPPRRSGGRATRSRAPAAASPPPVRRGSRRAPRSPERRGGPHVAAST